MRNLYLALIALTLTLGVACKKTNDVADSKPATEVKKELSHVDLKPNVLALENPGGGGGGIGGYPGGANTYPHNTGACYCGQYSVCHPVLPGHQPGCTGYQPIPGDLPSGSGPCRCSQWPPY